MATPKQPLVPFDALRRMRSLVDRDATDELKKMLEDPADLNDFLNSLLKVTKGKKEELQ